MSYDTLFRVKNNIKARKEYCCDSSDTFDGFMLIKRDANKQWIADDGVKDYEIEQSDIDTILSHANGGFKIKPGDLYHYECGIVEGEFYTWRCAMPMIDIIRKYELYHED